MNYIKSFLTLMLCCLATFAMAQKRVTGHVWSKVDGPIMMANVVEVDGSGRILAATTTDINGNFTLQVRGGSTRLRVSYIGYTTQFLTIGAQASFKIELTDQRTTGVVNVVAKRRVRTGGLDIPEKQMSATQQTLNMDALEGLSFETAGEALQGQIAGLDVVTNSGNLGSGTSMRLRGVTTISGSQEPLIVVNGNILEDYSKDILDLNSLDNSEQFATLLQVNPEDIKTINVLKDAAATALWGSRGANGVIEITTRRGTRGKTKVNFSYRFSGSWQPDGIKMLNGDEYTMMMKEGYFNPSQSPLFANIVELSYKRDRIPYYANFNKNTDWVKKVTKFGQVHNYGVSVAGGGEKASFRLSANYDNESGTIIKQHLDRFNTRLALDYYVSDRIKFSSNFSMVYVNNVKNYANILGGAYTAMPNMAINRWEYDVASGNYYDSGDYYQFFPRAAAAGEVTDGLSSYYLQDMINNGNPIAIANMSWNKESSYTIDPEFYINYNLLGKTAEETQLNYFGKVYINSFTNTNHSFYPATLTTSKWNDQINTADKSEFKSMRFETTHALTFIPKFYNENHQLQLKAEGTLSSSTSTSQNKNLSGLGGGITSPEADAYLRGASTSTGEGRWMAGTLTAFYSFKERYNLQFTLRADGSTKFGSGHKWGFFPALSGRWNIYEEKFFKPLKDIVSMFSVRGSWGVTGNQGFGEGTMYNKYSLMGIYGRFGANNSFEAIGPNNLRLINIRWERTSQWNLGFDLRFLDDLLMFDFNIYQKKTNDLLMGGVKIPSSTGFSNLDHANVGVMKNEGWELNFSSGDIVKIGKFKARARFNVSQNINRIEQMDESVLASQNSQFNYSGANQNWMRRVQIGNALGGIYGFRFKGVYRYDYEHSGYFRKDELNTRFGVYTPEYGSPTAAIAASRGENSTTPIVTDSKGNIVYDAAGNPLQMMYNYGGLNYAFSGGDVIYEDINHDGQINSLDVVYLGSSNPTLNGGLGFTLEYDRWQLTTNFSFRLGNKIINNARMSAENMRSNRNQSAAVNWRWRKNGDITEIPRAMNSNAGPSYNSIPSDRYVEKGDYLRFNYFQLSYNFKSELIKQYGLSSLRLSMSGNNLIFWSRYLGTDPDHSTSGFSPAMDNSQTPRSRSFTFSLNVGF